MFLLTNDDGIEAPGLRALRDALETEKDLCIVAPAVPVSECSHRVTTKLPIRVESHNRFAWAVEGTPADCVRLALTCLLSERPEWVVSGINRGGNLGADIYLSGTVAAAREATLMGFHAIAISQYVKKGRELDWTATTRRAQKAIAWTRNQPLSENAFWNINLPHLPPDAEEPDIQLCNPCKCPLPIAFTRSNNTYQYTGVYSERIRSPGADTDVCFRGQIAISRIDC